MIERNNPNTSIRRQCRLLSLNRSSVYYDPRPESDLNDRLMRRLDALYTAHPFLGYRKLTKLLQREGRSVNSKARAASHAAVGSASDLPEARHQQAAPETPDISVSAAQSGNHGAVSGVGDGQRPHQALAYQTPEQVHFALAPKPPVEMWTTQARCPHLHRRNNYSNQGLLKLLKKMG